VISQMTALVSAGQRFVGLASPFRYMFIAVIVAIVGWYWLSRQGPFRSAARRGGWRLVAAVLSSLGMLAFGIGTAIGQLVIGLVALIVGGLPAMVLVVIYLRERAVEEGQ
jgi:drug/metabolite transporter (DMT)-like permease